MSEITEIEPSENFNPQTYKLNDVYDPQLEDKMPVNYKEWGIPVPYKVFLSPYFDSNPVEPAVFKKELFDQAGSPTVEPPKHGDFRVPGATSGVGVYEMLQPYFAEKFKSYSTDKVIVKEGSDKISVHPFKLALFLSAYADEMSENFEIIDSLNEFIDKLVLIGVLPYIFDALRSYLKVADENGEIQAGVTEASVFLNSIKADLESKSDSLLSSSSFYGEDSFLQIHKDNLKNLLVAGADYEGEDQVFISMAQLDELLKEQIVDRYKNSKELNLKKGVNGAASELKLIERTYKEQKTVRRRIWRASLRFLVDTEKSAIDINTHHWLYWPTTGLSKHFTRGLSLNTLEFHNDGFLSAATITDDIDLRPQFWTKKVHELSADLYVYRSRIRASMNKIGVDKDSNPTLETIYDYDSSFRSDWSTYGEILAEIEALRSEVAEYGYELDIRKTDGDLMEVTELSSAVFKRAVHRYKQKVTRYRTEVIHRSRRYGPFWNKKTKRWTVKRKVPFQTTITKTKDIKKKISLDWDPINTYLEEDLDPITYSIVDEVKSSQQGQSIDVDKTEKALSDLKTILLNLKGVDTSESGYKLKNGDKDFRLFSVFNGQLLDQYGNDLPSVMIEAEDADKRSALLLLLPVIETDELGSNNVVGYKAIHNPTGFRNGYSIPNVVLHEEIVQEISESKNYFLGPLAHTETLLPGEKRYLNVQSSNSQTWNQSSSSKESIAQRSKLSRSLEDKAKNEVTNVVRQSQKSSWSVSASGSGSFGFAKVGGSASTSGSKSKSSENTVNRLNERISKVMSETSQENTLTINTSSSVSSESSYSEEKKIEIENFNTGRSVTHRFHQVMRKYISKARITDLKVLVTYDEEFVAGYGYRKSQLIPLTEMDSILPEMVESERKILLDALKMKIKKQYSDITVNKKDGTLEFPTDGINLPENSWYVNSGSFIIETDIAQKDILEEYVSNMRNAKVNKLNAEGKLLSSKASAIEEGHQVLPLRTDSFQVSSSEQKTE